MRLQPIHNFVVRIAPNIGNPLIISYTNKDLLRLFINICNGALVFRAFPIVEHMLKQLDDTDETVADVMPNFSTSDIIEIAEAIKELSAGGNVPTEQDVEDLLTGKKGER
jgi:hypothetical protein